MQPIEPPVAEKVIEYIERQIPDTYLIKCKPRLLQSVHNKSGEPKAGVFIIRKNNGTLDECIRLHENLINYILRGSTMTDPTKPDLKTDPTKPDLDNDKKQSQKKEKKDKK